MGNKILKTRIGRGLFLIISLYLIYSLSRSIINLRQKDNILIEEEKKLTELKEKNEELKEELDRLQSKQYLERQIRNKLNLGKEGDYLVILPSISVPVSPTPTPQLENWQKWLNKL